MYKLIPTDDDSRLFSKLEGKAAERCGAMGCLCADFGKNGREFWATWFDNQAHLKTPDFKHTFDELINTLRNDGAEPPFASRLNLEAFCAAHPSITAFKIAALDYSFYFRMQPQQGNYDVYCFAYDNRYLLPELAGQHELPHYCYSVLPSSGELIRIQNGKSGYHLCNNQGLSLEKARFKANDENGLRQITRAQEEAMLAGSLFGWNTPAAKPWNYEQSGTPRQQRPKRNEPER
jgi:hypothetical protein